MSVPITCTAHPDRIAVRYLPSTKRRYCTECWEGR